MTVAQIDTEALRGAALRLAAAERAVQSAQEYVTALLDAVMPPPPPRRPRGRPRKDGTMPGSPRPPNGTSKPHSGAEQHV